MILCNINRVKRKNLIRRLVIRSKFNNSIIYYDKKTKSVLAHRPLTDALTKNILKFDSKWEFTVYQALIELVGVEEVQLQVSIKLKKKTDKSPEMTYVCDFLVCGFWYVEAKGFLTPEAACKLKMLEVVHPDVAARMSVVSQKPVHLFGKKYPPTIDLAGLLQVVSNFQKYRTFKSTGETVGGSKVTS